MTSRIDWFSTLVGTSKEYVFYPSVGLSVVLSEIILLPKKVFSFWKIRGSYAQVGNPPSAYLPYATVVLENGNATSANFSPANHLKAEMTKAFEFGMDLRLFDNKLQQHITIQTHTISCLNMNCRPAQDTLLHMKMQEK